MLIAVSVNDSVRLYKAEAPRKLVLIRWEHKHVAVGFGEFYGFPLLDALHPQVSTLDATGDIAIYILYRVKRQVRYCGGQSNIVFVHKDGHIDEYMQSWPGYKHVVKMESWSPPFDVLTGQLLREAAAGNNEGIDATLKLIRRQLKNKPHGRPDSKPRIVKRK